MGCAGIQLQNNQVGEYPSMHLSTSNKGWHSHWFYLKSDAAASLLEFTERLVKEVPNLWRKWVSRRRTRRKSGTTLLPSES